MANDLGAPGAPYPAYPPPPPAYQVPRRKGGCMRMIGIMTVAFVGLVMVVAIIAIAAGGGDDDDGGGDAATGTATTAAGAEGPVSNSGNTENPPPEDIAINECGGGVGNPGGGNFVGAAGAITNNSSEASTYLGSVEFLDANGTRYAESPIASSAVGPGQMAEFSAPTVTEAREGTTCRVAQIERFAS